MRLNDSISLTLDVEAWMRSTGRFDKIKATDREWVAATCVFHDDRHPSFAVNRETGVFKCQACGASGTFVKLVHHVEGEHDTLYDAEQSLIARYGRFVPDVEEPLVLDFGDVEEETFVERDVTSCLPPSDYLEQRGIQQHVQTWFDAHHDGHVRATAFPWHDAGGRIVTVKYRSIADKRFWYDPPVSPGRKKRLLYGLHLATHAPRLVVVEGEIDAMSVVQAGFAAVALGGAHLSTEQRDLLRNHCCDEVVVFTDNDVAGRRVRAEIIEGLVGYKRVSVVDWSLASHNKDANDVLCYSGEAIVQAFIECRIPVGLPLKFD